MHSPTHKTTTTTFNTTNRLNNTTPLTFTLPCSTWPERTSRNVATAAGELRYQQKGTNFGMMEVVSSNREEQSREFSVSPPLVRLSLDETDSNEEKDTETEEEHEEGDRDTTMVTTTTTTPVLVLDTETENLMRIDEEEPHDGSQNDQQQAQQPLALAVRIIEMASKQPIVQGSPLIDGTRYVLAVHNPDSLLRLRVVCRSCDKDETPLADLEGRTVVELDPRQSTVMNCFTARAADGPLNLLFLVAALPMNPGDVVFQSRMTVTIQ